MISGHARYSHRRCGSIRALLHSIHFTILMVLRLFGCGVLELRKVVLISTVALLGLATIHKRVIRFPLSRGRDTGRWFSGFMGFAVAIVTDSLD